mgnify:CR=1 FL=1
MYNYSGSGFMFYFWLAVILILGFFEIITVGLVSIWFVISGIVALILSFFIDNFIIQFAVFVILGVVLMVTTRKTLTKMFVKGEKTNLDRVVGMSGIVTEDINKNEIGEVKVDGKKWSAYSSEKILVGSTIKVLKIDGVKLLVERVKE